MVAESSKTKKTRNIIMVAIIAALAICAIVLVGNLQGWFGGGSTNMSAANKVGTVNVIRSDISYALEDGAEIRQNDTIETLSGSSIAVNYSSGGSIYIDSDTQVSFGSTDAKSSANSSINLKSGQIVANLPTQFSVGAGDTLVSANNAVLTVSLQSGALNVGVLSGSALVNSQTIDAGNNALIDNAGAVQVSTLLASSYDDYMLGALSDISSTTKLCFSADELSTLVAQRADQKKQAQSQAANSSSGGGDKSCTIEIRCDTILANTNKLLAEKTSYVPNDGVILPVTKVSFSDGQTVYDVLSRACEGAGIQMEASWSPLYSAYYIEGINNLYELDCGSASGWTYKVNGWVPNYGVSGYKLQDGDVIQILYTCDYGNDV